MQAENKHVLIYVTFPDAAAATKVGESLVERRLAACVNILNGMTAIYVWQGNLQRDSEVVMVVKTRASLADRVVGEVRAAHSYETPAIVVLPIIGGSTEFLAWIEANTQAPG